MNRVVITGAGIISPLGNNVHTFWNNLKQGKSGISTLDVDEDYGKTAAGIVYDFDPVEIFGKKTGQKNGPLHAICFGCHRTGIGKLRAAAG